MTPALLPQHIAIIMDGNGRWAKRRHLPRVAGHRAGAEAIKKVIKACVEKKISVLTLFAFSSENWRRPPQEVNFLMDLFVTALQRESEKLHQQNIQLHIVGDRSRFDKELQIHMAAAEQLTQHNTGLKLMIAANYGGQWDIASACRQITEQVMAGTLSLNDISAEKIAGHLAFSKVPDPDLFIRTSGEQRISNFMMWQLAYTELYFTDTLWPDFDENEFEKALTFFMQRERRFGQTSEQVQSC